MTKGEQSPQSRRHAAFERFIAKGDEYIFPIASHLVFLRMFHYRHLGRKAAIRAGQKVLDLGSGYPAWKVYSHQVGENGLFVAADVNANIQRRSRKIGNIVDKISGRNHSREQLVVADGRHLPFADESFNTVIVSNFIRGYDHLAEAERVLEGGGRLLISVAELGFVKREAKRIAARCIAAGFEAVSISKGSMAGLIPGLVRNNYVEAVKSA